MPYCGKCGNVVTDGAVYCQACGALQASAPPSRPPAAGALVPPAQSYLYAAQPSTEFHSIYTPGFNLATLSPQHIEQLKAHSLRDYPTPVAVLLHFVTLGVFTTIYHGLKHSRLPLIRYDDFRAGKAIGFLFIPFFNFYWIFIFWLRLVDRINLQFRLRGMPDCVSRGLALSACIVTLIPYVGLVSFLILFPILSGQIQSACNQLVLIAHRQNGGPVP